MGARRTGDEWPLEWITQLQHYGPASGKLNELVSGAQEPICNLNCIIRLQAILEIITNDTAHALDLLADQAMQMWAAVFQHQIVLDYLLAKEWGVRGIINDANCCLKIYSNGHVVEHTTSGIQKSGPHPCPDLGKLGIWSLLLASRYPMGQMHTFLYVMWDCIGFVPHMFNSMFYTVDPPYCLKYAI